MRLRFHLPVVEVVDGIESFVCIVISAQAELRANVPNHTTGTFLRKIIRQQRAQQIGPHPPTT